MKCGLRAPTLATAVGVCLLLNLIPSMMGTVFLGADTEIHLFFADHYRMDWFNPCESRWYGGFLVYSYPPLFHQIVALLGHAVDLDFAFNLTRLAVICAVPLSVGLLTEEVSGPAAAGWAALFAAFSSGIYMTVYGYGQLPNLLSLVLSFAAAAYLMRYLRGGKALVAWVGLSGAAVAAHHMTGIVALPMLSLAALMSLLTSTPRAAWRSVAVRTAVAGVSAAAAAAVTLVPFAWWVSHARVSQAEIYHPTRHNIFRHADDAFVYFTGLWGGGLLALVPAIYVSVRRPALRAWTLLVMLWTLLALGPRLTPLPHLLFGRWTDWLTYERFSLWASLLVLVSFGAWISTAASRVTLGLTLGAFAVLMLATCTETVREPLVQSHLSESALEDAARFLDSGGHDAWRYLALGLGQRDMPRLSRLTHAPSVDGAYFTARRDPLLSRSGTGELDQALDGRALASSAVRFVLSHPKHYCLRWVICGNARASETLAAMGWKRLGMVRARGFEPLPDDGITVWEAPFPDIPTVHAPDRTSAPGLDGETPPAFFSWLWGVGPPVLLAVGLFSAWRGRTGME